MGRTFVNKFLLTFLLCRDYEEVTVQRCHEPVARTEARSLLFDSSVKVHRWWVFIFRLGARGTDELINIGKRRAGSIILSY